MLSTSRRSQGATGLPEGQALHSVSGATWRTSRLGRLIRMASVMGPVGMAVWAAAPSMAQAETLGARRPPVYTGRVLQEVAPPATVSTATQVAPPADPHEPLFRDEPLSLPVPVPELRAAGAATSVQSIGLRSAKGVGAHGAPPRTKGPGSGVKLKVAKPRPAAKTKVLAAKSLEPKRAQQRKTRAEKAAGSRHPAARQVSGRHLDKKQGAHKPVRTSAKVRVQQGPRRPVSGKMVVARAKGARVSP